MFFKRARQKLLIFRDTILDLSVTLMQLWFPSDALTARSRCIAMLGQDMRIVSMI